MTSTTIRPAAVRTMGCALLIALALGACRREEPAPTDTPQAGADAAAQTDALPAAPAIAGQGEPPKIAGTDAIAVSENTSADAATQPATPTVAGTELKDFAGRFAAQDASIQLNGDGTYAMTVRAQSAGADLESSGTWTVQDGGQALLLDANDKSEPDRRYAVVSADELKASDGGQVLRRQSGG